MAKIYNSVGISWELENRRSLRLWVMETLGKISRYLKCLGNVVFVFLTRYYWLLKISHNGITCTAENG